MKFVGRLITWNKILNKPHFRIIQVKQYTIRVDESVTGNDNI